jgi:hypothetical protein
MDRALAPVLRIVFPKPGFFLVDVRMTIGLDGGIVYDGGFLGGVDVSGAVAPGMHTVTTRIDIGGFARERVYPVTVPPGRGLTVELAYSRFWGNFTKTPKLTAW